MDRLPAEVHQRILSYLDLSGLLNSVDVSTEWRKIIEEKSFLDKFSQRRFGLKLESLPASSLYERLLLDTQRLCSRESVDTQFLETPKDLLKLYSMELRSSWFPFGFKFDGNDEEIIPNIKTRELVFPLASDYGKVGVDLALEAKFRKISARIHVGVPRFWKHFIFAFLVNSTSIRDVVQHLMDQLSGLTPQRLDAVLPPLLLAVRHIVDQAVLNETELRFFYNKCPAPGPLATSHESIRAFQIKMVEHLDETIRSIGFLLSREIRNLLESTDRNITPDILKSIGQFVEKLFECELVRTSAPHTCSPRKKSASQNFNVILIRAIRRGINSKFVGEVKSYFLTDPLLFQLVHCWSFQGKGHNGDLCFDRVRIDEFKHCDRCFMNFSIRILNVMCTRCGHPELWPAVVLKKAVGDVANVGMEIRKEVEKYIGL